MGYAFRVAPTETGKIQGNAKPDERFYPRPLRHLSSYLSGLVQGKLWLKVLIGMFLGLITGTLLGPSVGLVEPETGTLIGNWLAFPGQLFLATIQMIVIPLVIASVVRSAPHCSLSINDLSSPSGRVLFV